LQTSQTNDAKLRRKTAPVGSGAAPPLRPRNFRIPAAITYSGFSRSELYRRIGDGRLVTRKAGKTRFIDGDSLDANIDALPTG
jgi:hypothetical protein